MRNASILLISASLATVFGFFTSNSSLLCALLLSFLLCSSSFSPMAHLWVCTVAHTHSQTIPCHIIPFVCRCIPKLGATCLLHWTELNTNKKKTLFSLLLLLTFLNGFLVHLSLFVCGCLLFHVCTHFLMSGHSQTKGNGRAKDVQKWHLVVLLTSLSIAHLGTRRSTPSSWNPTTSQPNQH